MAMSGRRVPTSPPGVPIPSSNTGVDWLDGIVNFAIKAYAYDDFRDAAKGQWQTLHTVQTDQNVGARPAVYRPEMAQGNGMMLSPALIVGGAAAIGLIIWLAGR